MAVKLADTLAPMGDFPVAMATGVNITKSDNTEKSLQSMFEDGELGGGEIWTGTRAEYNALDPKPAAGTPVIITDDFDAQTMAATVGYNNNTTGLVSSNVQGALDEIYAFAAAICKFDVKVVLSLPTTGVKGTIYFVAKFTSDDNDQFNEYIWVDNRFELIGNTSIDLSDYAKKTDIPTSLPASNTTSTYSATGTAPVNGKAVASAISGKANSSALGTQVTYSLSGTTLTITAK